MKNNYIFFDKEKIRSLFNYASGYAFIKKQSFNNFFRVDIDKYEKFKTKSDIIYEDNFNHIISNLVYVIVLFRLKSTNIYSIQKCKILGDVVFCEKINQNKCEIVDIFYVKENKEDSEYSEELCDIALEYFEKYVIHLRPQLRDGYVFFSGSKDASEDIRCHIDAVINHELTYNKIEYSASDLDLPF